MDGPIEQLRENLAAVEDLGIVEIVAVEDLGIVEIVDHYDAIIRELEQPPIIIGHSFGGVFAQMLLDRGLGAAGVAIDSGPVKGLLGVPPSTLRSGWPV